MNYSFSKRGKAKNAIVSVAAALSMVIAGGAFAQTASAATAPDCSTVATTPAKVNKALDPLMEPSKNPTIDPKVNEIQPPKTNFFTGSTYWRQVPLYYNGQLGNPEGNNLVVPVTVGNTVVNHPVGNQTGVIISTQKIQPQHADETILEGDFDGQSAWMVGYSDATKDYYLYQLDASGTQTNVTPIPAPNSPDYSGDWTMSFDYGNGRVTKFSWFNKRLQMDVSVNGKPVDHASIAPPQTLKVGVQYLDTKGNEIAPSTTVSGYRSTFVTINPPTIPGYRLVKVPYENQDHQFYLSGQGPTTPTKGFNQDNFAPGLASYTKILDSENTQEEYVTIDRNGVTETSAHAIMKADPYGFAVFIGGELGEESVSQLMPPPVGNPFQFVYEPVVSHTLTVKYVDKTTGKEMCRAYTSTGTGSYDITVPVFKGYTTTTPEVKGVLTKDTTVTVEYTPTEKPNQTQSNPPTKGNTPAGKNTGSNPPAKTDKTSSNTPAAGNGGTTVVQTSGSSSTPVSGGPLAHTGSDVIAVAVATLLFALVGAVATVLKRNADNA